MLKKAPFLCSAVLPGCNFSIYTAEQHFPLLSETLERCFHCHTLQRLTWNHVQVSCLNKHPFVLGWWGLVLLNSQWKQSDGWSDRLPIPLRWPELLLLSPSRPHETWPITGSDQHVVFPEFGIMQPYELFQRAHTRSDFMHAWGSQWCICVLSPLFFFYLLSIFF